MMHDRRRFPRFPFCVPVRVDTTERSGRIGFTRDASAQGVLLGGPNRFELGERVLLKFSVGDEIRGPETLVTGRVVRVERNKNGNHLWRYLAAVCFEALAPDLVEALFEQEEPTAVG